MPCSKLKCCNNNKSNFDIVHPGTIIITDQWRTYVYSLITPDGYVYYTIHHPVQFVILMITMCTCKQLKVFGPVQNILWKKSGISKEDHADYLNQFLWGYKVEKKETF